MNNAGNVNISGKDAANIPANFHVLNIGNQGIKGKISRNFIRICTTAPTTVFTILLSPQNITVIVVICNFKGQKCKAQI